MSDNPSKVFAPLDVDTTYYEEWSCRCRAPLRRKECLDVLSTERPAGAEEAAKYDEKNNKAVGHITDNLSLYALSKVRQHEDSARDMWEALRLAYENKSMSNQLNILTRLINLRMQEDTTLDKHYANLDGIVSELRLAGAKSADDDALLTAVLMASMPPSFRTAVTALRMSTNEMPTLEEVRKKLRDHSLALALQKTTTPEQSTSTSTGTVMTATGNNHASFSAFWISSARRKSRRTQRPWRLPWWRTANALPSVDELLGRKESM